MYHPGYTKFYEYMGIAPNELGELDPCLGNAEIQWIPTAEKEDGKYVVTMRMENESVSTTEPSGNRVPQKEAYESMFTTYMDSTSESVTEQKKKPFLPEDPIIHFYYGSLTVLGMYIMYRFVKKYNGF